MSSKFTLKTIAECKSVCTILGFLWILCRTCVLLFARTVTKDLTCTDAELPVHYHVKYTYVCCNICHGEFNSVSALVWRAAIWNRQCSAQALPAIRIWNSTCNGTRNGNFLYWKVVKYFWNACVWKIDEIDIFLHKFSDSCACVRVKCFT